MNSIFKSRFVPLYILTKPVNFPLSKCCRIPLKTMEEFSDLEGYSRTRYISSCAVCKPTSVVIKIKAESQVLYTILFILEIRESFLVYRDNLDMLYVEAFCTNVLPILTMLGYSLEYDHL